MKAVSYCCGFASFFWFWLPSLSVCDHFSKTNAQISFKFCMQLPASLYKRIWKRTLKDLVEFTITAPSVLQQKLFDMQSLVILLHVCFLWEYFGVHTEKQDGNQRCFQLFCHFSSLSFSGLQTRLIITWLCKIIKRLLKKMFSDYCKMYLCVHASSADGIYFFPFVEDAILYRVLKFAIPVYLHNY